MKSTAHIGIITASLLALPFGGCTMGPDFKTPDKPSASGYTAAAPALPEGAAQRFVTGQDISGQWWEVFRCESLNRLISRALANSPDLQSARAALVVARENTLAGKGARWPSVDASLGASRSRTSKDISATPNNGAYTYSLYTPQVSVSYALDVFGLNRRTVEVLKAQQEQARFELAAAHTTLSANLVAAAIQEASLRAQILATRELVAISDDTLRITRNQYKLGYASSMEVAAQEAAQAQAVAALPPLLKQLAQQRNVITALAGCTPDVGVPETFELGDLHLPETLPLTLPSKLVGQRADIRQAEENLHAACAQVGVAVASRFPNIILSADAGSMALALKNLFTADTAFGDMAANLTQPIFHGGALKHQEKAARAAYEQADAQYRSTVINAFHDVADTLAALEHDADGLEAAARARNVAANALALTQKQADAGYAGSLALLSAKQTYQQALLTLVDARTNRFSDTAALFQALGGGWWNRSDLPQQ